MSNATNQSGTGHWMVATVIDDSDLMFCGKSLSAWYEEDRSQHGATGNGASKVEQESRGRSRERQGGSRQHRHNHHHHHDLAHSSSSNSNSKP